MLNNCFLAVQDLVNDEDHNIVGAPLLGEDWIITPATSGWFFLQRGAQRVACWRANSLGSTGLFAIFGEKFFLDNLAEGRTNVMPAREAWDRRAEAPVRQFLRFWPTWNCAGFERVSGSPQAFSGVRTLTPPGVQIPDPTVTALPWALDETGAIVPQAQAVIRVDSILSPALHRTIAGLKLNEVLENEDPRA